MYLDTLEPRRVKLGHMVIAAFGKDDPWAFERWCEWSMTAPNADPLDKQREKWERNLNSDPRYSPASFWMAARDAGYTGPLPFSKKEQDKFEALDILAEIDLFRSTDGLAYGTIAPRRHEPVKSQEFTSFLRLRCLDKGQMLSAELIHALKETTIALASQKPRRELHLRFASDGERRYVFLADDGCTIVEIDAHGWRRSDRDVHFRRGDGLPLPMPEPGSIDDLRQFVNMSDDAWPFHLAWMVCCVLRPGRAAPIAVLTGPKGSAKSTALQFTVDLLDPKIGAKAGMPKSEDDLVVSAHNSAIVSFDNASTLATLSDPLCRLATGGGTRKRELYTDANVVALDVIRPVIISGIDPTVYQQDLIDRLVLIEMVPPNRRIDDEELAEQFDRARPRVLGGFFTLCSQVMRRLGEIDLGDDPPRMAGFAKIGEAVARLLGHEPGWFVAEYRQMLEINAEEAAEGDCVYQMIVQLVANLETGRDGYQGTSQDLLEYMTEQVRKGYMVAAREDVPKNARAMSSRLRRAMHALKDIAQIEVTQSKHDRTWRIKKREVASDEEVFASIAPPF